MGNLESFVRLFRGRADAYGAWAGRCVHSPLTPEHFHRHLFSHNSRDWIGVYNVIDTRCSWGCVDMDVPDLVTISRVQATLTEAHIPSWIEQTTRGYHLWVFPFDLLVDAATMRDALRAACLDVGYQPREVFPKQTEANGMRLGNYVRLPLNGSLSNPPPVDVRRFIHTGVSLQDMDQQRATTADLRALADTAPPSPQAVDISVDVQAGLDVQWTIEGIGGQAHRLWRDGPRFGDDRSTALAKLAHRLADADVDPSTALTIIASADERWGKFTDRGETGLRLMRKIVGNAYGTRSSA